jgi:hypothetical protein
MSLQAPDESFTHRISLPHAHVGRSDPMPTLGDGTLELSMADGGRHRVDRRAGVLPCGADHAGLARLAAAEPARPEPFAVVNARNAEAGKVMLALLEQPHQWIRQHPGDLRAAEWQGAILAHLAAGRS